VEFHFLDVGCGNMVLMKFPGGRVWIYDCNLTDENTDPILGYVGAVIGWDAGINVFINSHRDADHMRGIKELHRAYPIGKIWDSGVPGTSPDCEEYLAYMDLKRRLPSSELQPRRVGTYGEVELVVMNSKWEDYTDSNEQSLVLKFSYKGSSVMLAGDTNYRPWKEKILPHYPDASLKSSILYAAHHGSLTFFDDPSDPQHYYTGHLSKINPVMTLISVGTNVHGLPDAKAKELYGLYTTGSAQGNKIFTTQRQGNMKLLLKAEGGWALNANQ
jgi:beta-lactamase superfamily II metal-dependent hydrolase